MNSSTNNPLAPSLEVLLSESDWLRRIARGLLGEDGGEDLAQDVMVEALRSRPELSGGRLRSWLFTAARRMAGRQHSRSSQRFHVEREGARAELVDSNVEARLELHRCLSETIRQLDQPYREVLVLRYFEGLAAREVALRLGLPVTTVSKRVSRGLAQLRQRLDGEFDGGRGAWSLALLPLTSAPSNLVPWPTAASKATALGASLTLTVVMLAKLSGIAVVVALALFFMNRDPSAPRGVRGMAEPPEVSLETPVIVVQDQSVARVAVESASGPEFEFESEVSELSSSPLPQGMLLRIVDTLGRPLPSARAAWLSPDYEVTALVLDSEARGCLPEGSSGGRLYARAEGYSGAWMALASNAPGERDLVLAEERVLRGLLLEDEAPPSQPLDLVLTTFQDSFWFQPGPARAMTNLVRVGALVVEFRTKTEVDGSFQFKGFSHDKGGTVHLPEALGIITSTSTPRALPFDGPGGSGEPRLVGRLKAKAARFGQETEELLIEAMRLPSIRGRLVWNETSEPVEGHFTYFLGMGHAAAGTESMGSLDADGCFEVALLLGPEALKLPFESRGALVRSRSFRMSFGSHAGFQILGESKFSLLDRSYPIELGELRVTKPELCALRILDFNGNALEGAAVASSVDSASSDSSGMVEVRALVGDSLRVLATDHGYEEFHLGDLERDAEGTQELRLTQAISLRISLQNDLQDGKRLTYGLRLSWSRSPFPEVLRPGQFGLGPMDSLLRASYTGSRLLSWQWDDGGALTSVDLGFPSSGPLILPGLIDGVDLQIEVLDKLGQALATRQLRTSSKAPGILVVLDANEWSIASLRLRIVDAQGIAIPKGYLFIGGSEEIRGNRFESVDGLFEAHGLKLGLYDLEISAPGYVPQSLLGHLLTQSKTPFEVLLQESP